MCIIIFVCNDVRICIIRGWQVEAAMVGWSSPEHNLFPWLDMDDDHVLTFDEVFSIYKTLFEDGQVSFFYFFIFFIFLRVGRGQSRKCF